MVQTIGYYPAKPEFRRNLEDRFMKYFPDKIVPLITRDGSLIYHILDSTLVVYYLKVDQGKVTITGSDLDKINESKNLLEEIAEIKLL